MAWSSRNDGSSLVKLVTVHFISALNVRQVRNHLGSRPGFLVACAVGVLVAPAFAQAGGGGSAERVKLNPADQAMARKAVLTKAELPETNAWKGVPPGPSAASALVAACARGQNLSRYVLTGHSTVDFRYGHTRAKRDGESMYGAVEVFSTVAIGEADWKASSPSYNEITCIYRTLAKQPGSHAVLKSVNRLPFYVGSYSAAFRVRFSVTTHGLQIPAAMDMFFFLAGRCQELYSYGYVDNPALETFAPSVQDVLKGIVQGAVKAGCLRDNPV